METRCYIKMTVKFDKIHDILYVAIADRSKSYGDELENGLVVMRDMDDDTVTGITIFDFQKKAREESLESLHLPFSIDFKNDIFPQI